MSHKALVTLAGGEKLELDQPGEVRSADGYCILRIHELVHGRCYAMEVFSRKPSWPDGGTLSRDPINIESIHVGLPDSWRPTYHPYDGTYRPNQNDPYDAKYGPLPPELAGCANVWVVLHPSWPKPIHAKIPATGYFILDGRRSLYLVFGEPGIDLQANRSVDLAYEKFMGAKPGQFQSTGEPLLDAFMSSWDSSFPEDFHWRDLKSTAGQWWCAAHEKYSWSWSPNRGIFHMGSTPGADGSGPDGRMGGENARYTGPLFLAGAGGDEDKLLALVVARHVAAHGFVHLDPDGVHTGQFDGMRRYEKSTKGYTDDYMGSRNSHNWLDDLIFMAAYFHDPIVFRAAKDGLRRVLQRTAYWGRKSGPRVVDRALAACLAAHTLLEAAEGAKYIDHAATICDQLVSTVQAGERWIQDDGLYPSHENAKLGGALHAWQAGGVLFRMIQTQEMLGEARWHEFIMDQARYLHDNCVLTEPFTYTYQWGGTRTHAPGTCAYFGFPNWTSNNPTPLPQTNVFGFKEGPLGGTFAFPTWVVKMNAWYLPALHYLAKNDAAFQPTVRRCYDLWVNSVFSWNPGDFWSVGGNISAKVCGQQALPIRPPMIQELRSWTSA